MFVAFDDNVIVPFYFFDFILFASLQSACWHIRIISFVTWPINHFVSDLEWTFFITHNFMELMLVMILFPARFQKEIDIQETHPAFHPKVLLLD
jgi:hypothetical protein